MRIPALFLAACIAVVATATAMAADHENDPRLKGSYKFHEGGWTYVHLQGTPGQIGFQHGYLLAREIEDNIKVYQVEAPH
ncbi:MAG: peptidase C45, partial [Terracidiphilus sp.]